MSPGEENGTAPLVRAGDRIGALSDDILHHLLSFLPVQSAVRTCVLARRWRHLWRSTTCMPIVGVQKQGPVQDLVKLLHHLLILRERTFLDTVEIKFSEFLKDDVPYVNLWTRFAVQWGVRALTLRIKHLNLDGLPLVSQRLRTLHLDGVGLQETFLDFSSCPALADLKMECCDINVHKISSRSLKHLRIIYCYSSRNYQGEDLIEMKGSYSSMERSSAISEHLKIVEVKFPEIDKRIHKVLKFLCTFNIRFTFE